MIAGRNSDSAGSLRFLSGSIAGVIDGQGVGRRGVG